MVHMISRGVTRELKGEGEGVRAEVVRVVLMEKGGSVQILG
jgi:hypothetical protein